MLKRTFIGCGALSTAVVLAMGCSVQAATDNVQDELGIGCEEWTGKGEIDARVDAQVRVYMEATRDISSASANLKVTVRDACAAVARDLGAEDTWSKLGDGDDAISNSGRTGACDVASAKIDAVMTAHASANFAIVETPGKCYRDFEAQVACESQCKAEATCQSGTCETRCEPAQLSVKCSGKCKASATCEGTASIEANCMGVCQSTCVGECKGTCTKADGSTTENDPNCNGKCSSSCNGKCRGVCKVEAEAGIECGAEVRCTGGCEGEYTEPKCVTTFTPPKCSVNQTCLDSCSAKAEANLKCEPSKIELYANVSVHADVEKLVATVNANVSKLVAAVEAEGKVIVDACDRLAAHANVTANAELKLNAKTVSCGAAAGKQATKAAQQMKTSFTAAKQVTDTCKKHSK